MAAPLLLRVAAGATLAFGAPLVLWPAGARRGFALMMFGDAAAIDAFAPPALAYVTLLHGVLGAVMVGWAVSLLGLLGAPWRQAPAGAAALLAASVGSWFVLDTVFSLLVGAWQNALLNTAFVLPFAIGLVLAARRHRGP